MSKTAKPAYALQGFYHADDVFGAKDIIKGLPQTQFNDWEMVGLVREATEAEVAAWDKRHEPPAPPPGDKPTK